MLEPLECFLPLEQLEQLSWEANELLETISPDESTQQQSQQKQKQNSRLLCVCVCVCVCVTERKRERERERKEEEKEEEEITQFRPLIKTYVQLYIPLKTFSIRNQ